MPKSSKEKLLAAIDGLSLDELLQIKRKVLERESSLGAGIVDQEREQSVDACPHCGVINDFVKDGRENGRQRFWCKACNRTFNAMTGTPFAKLRQREKHHAYAQQMLEHKSIPETAEQLNISWETAWRWRHRILCNISRRQPLRLSGVVEADETFFLECFKGQRGGLPRPGKKRGMPATKRGLSSEQIPVLTAMDRTTKALLSIKVKTRQAKHLSPVLAPKLAQDAVLIADGHRAYRTLGKAHKIEVRVVPRDPKHRTVGALHLNNLNRYHKGLKDWMRPFHGVATKYLDLYLGWHRLVDSEQPGITAQQLLRLSIDPKA